MNKFEGNIAHTNQKDGLVIWPSYDPRGTEAPCTASGNNPVVAEFRDFMGYNNRNNGAMAFEVGAVQFIDFKMANNLLANMEYSYLVSGLGDDVAKIVGGWSLGKSPQWESAWLDDAAPHGVVFARSENFRVVDTKFCYYEWELDNGGHDIGAACLGPCSNCNDA